MSTSLLYHAFGLRGYDYVHTKYEGGAVNFRVTPKPELLVCPCCRSWKIKRRGAFERKLRLPPIGSNPAYVLIKVPRIECLVCGAVRLIELRIAEAHRRFTRAFERLVVGFSQMMTLKDIARHLRVGWDCIKDIVKRNLHQRFSKLKFSHLKYLAIDEISIAKGHKYLTVVLDLERGQVVFVGDGKGSEALKPFWNQLKRSKAKISAIATDMSPAYVASVLEHWPSASLVFDHFHVVKLMNEQLSDLRRKLYQETMLVQEKKVLKGSRWLLLKSPENLDEQRNERQRLKEALALNEPLSTAYYLKEDLRQIWSQPDKPSAALVLDGWIKTASTSGIGPLVKMGRTLAKYRFGILNWYDHPISSGPLEGTNNKIKTLKRQAYGFRDLNYFKLRILAIHQAKYAFTG